MQLAGLHHVTCVCSDAQRTLDFYRDRGVTLKAVRARELEEPAPAA